MKYVITEIQLYKMVFRYLDMHRYKTFETEENIYFLNNITDDTAQISIYVSNAFGEIKNWMYVNGELIDELSNFFSIDEDECLETIKRWVSNFLNMEVGKIENTDNTGAHHRLKTR